MYISENRLFMEFLYRNSGLATSSEIRQAENNFIKYLGDLQDEFIQRGGRVTIDFNEPIDSVRRYIFVFTNPLDVGPFLEKAAKRNQPEK